MNICKAPSIGNKVIINCKDKATVFANCFAEQCPSIINDITLLPFYHLTRSRIDNSNISSEEITSLIRSISKGKACGYDDISSHMLILWDNTVTLPLKLIFDQILATGIHPDIWKLANETPIHKRDDKQLVENYRPISLQPICGKLFEKIIVNQLYEYLRLII